jgi:hypothetical protein
MKYRMTFIVGTAVGYVLGSRAGRERYEQIKRLSRRISENPTVQETAGLVRAQAGELAGTAKHKVTGKFQETVSDRVPGLRKNKDDLPSPPAAQSTSTSS